MVKESVPVWTCADCGTRVEGMPEEKKCPKCDAQLKNVHLKLPTEQFGISDSIGIDVSFLTRNWIVFLLTIIGLIFGFIANFLSEWHYGVIVWISLTVIGFVLNNQPKKVRKTKKIM